MTEERHGILADVTVAISNCNANIKKAQVKLSPDLKGLLDFEVSLKNLNQLNKVISEVEKIEDVLFVERIDIKGKKKKINFFYTL